MAAASFRRVGLVPAWDRGRPASASRSVGRSHSRSRSTTRDGTDWGGDAQSSVGDMTNDSTPQHRKLLPWNNADADLEARFEQWTTTKEAGPASAFVTQWCHTFKTRQSFDKEVWEYSGETTTWKAIPFDEFAISRVGAWCSRELGRLRDDVYNAKRRGKQVDDQNDDADKINAATQKAWAAAERAVAVTIDHMGKHSGVTNTAKFAVIKLRDESFFAQLDSHREVVSFKNGCLFLNSGRLCERDETCSFSYALDYNYDPSVSTANIERFIHQLFDDEDSEALMKVHAGYMFTGETTHKAFYQFAADKDHGKSVLLKVLANAMGALVSDGVVPIAEFSRDTQFETTINDEASKFPPKRLFICDECNKKTVLNEQFINGITSGLTDIKVPCRVKQKAASTPVMWHAKVVLATNHELSVSSSSTGTLGRLTGPRFPFKFIEPSLWNPETAMPEMRKADPELVKYLMSPEARPEIAAWMAQGARTFYATGFPRSSAWETQAFELRTRGDEFARWITETYTPTGTLTDRIATADMRTEFTNSHKHVKDDVTAGLEAALATMSVFITKTEWAVHSPVYNPGPFSPAPVMLAVPGYTGLRQRRFGDASWRESMLIAIDTANAVRAGRPTE